jgi:hypothetical protein
MKKSAGILIAALLTSNATLVGALLLKEDRIYADHLRRIRVDVKETGNLELTVGDSSTSRESLVVLTPRASLEVQHEIGRMIQIITEMAEQTKQRPDPVL